MRPGSLPVATDKCPCVTASHLHPHHCAGTYHILCAKMHCCCMGGWVLHAVRCHGQMGAAMSHDLRCCTESIEWLAQGECWALRQACAGWQVWQVLPLVPPETMAWSPYSGLDALCGNVLMISLDSLVDDGLLSKSDLPAEVPVADVDFPAVSPALMDFAAPVRHLCLLQVQRAFLPGATQQA